MQYFTIIGKYLFLLFGPLLIMSINGPVSRTTVIFMHFNDFIQIFEEISKCWVIYIKIVQLIFFTNTYTLHMKLYRLVFLQKNFVKNKRFLFKLTHCHCTQLIDLLVIVHSSKC